MAEDEDIRRARQARELIDAGTNIDRDAARQARMDELKAERERKAAEKVAERAASNPKFDPSNRPEGEINSGFIIYNSWVGGATTGEWRTYRVANTPANMEKYGSRVFPGDTQQSGASAVGANALEKQPLLVKDEYGNIIGYEKDGRQFTGVGFSGGTGGGGGTAGGGTGGGGTGGAGGAGGTGGTGGTGGAGGGGFTPTTYTAPDGRIFTDLNSYNTYIAQLAADAKRQSGQSAYNILFEQFNRYGLGALVAPLQSFIVEGLSPEEFTLRLRDTDAYKKRFAANQARIQKGLTALSEAEYIGLEDQYQNVMRNYGLPASYYARGEMGRQEGFEKFIAGDVSAAELEDRILTAQSRVLNAAPQVAQSLRQFYPEITGGDILAYTLDPDKALSEIKRKIGAAEIGAGAAIAGLATGLSRAEELQRYGVTGEQARQGFQTIADILPSASKLGDIYAKQGMGPYTQSTAEQEVFGIPGAVDAQKKRRQLAQLETAQFSGQAGVGALGRERAGQF
jgi:hypothetical protein